MFVFVHLVVFILFSKFIMSLIIFSATFPEILLPSSGRVYECVWYLCVRRGLKYFEVVSESLTLVVGLYGTIFWWTYVDSV